MADRKATANRFYTEVMSNGDLDVIDELLADDFVEHEAVPGGATGKDAVRQFTQEMRTAFPDLKVDVEAMVADGDEVWVHAVATGTNTGDFMDIPATGKTVTMGMIDRIKFKGDKAVEHWGVSDTFGMMTQLGVIPETG
jgi:steroid delta-isomerase-like uncharacterized protein